MFKGQSMDSFKSFLVARKSVPEKRIPYYVNWVRRFQDTIGKRPDDPFTDDEVRQFLKGMELHHEEWQVKQAKEALDLYRFYRWRLLQDRPAEDGDNLKAWQEMAESSSASSG